MQWKRSSLFHFISEEDILLIFDDDDDVDDADDRNLLHKVVAVVLQFAQEVPSLRDEDWGN